MICRMCLLDSTVVLNIFDTDSHEFNIAATISQHFWFEPTKDDSISNVICSDCWTKIDNFHIHFLSVKEAQLKQTALLQIKEEASLQNVVFLKVEDNSAEFEDTVLLGSETIVKESDKFKKDEFFDGCSINGDSQCFADATADSDHGNSSTTCDAPNHQLRHLAAFTF